MPATVGGGGPAARDLLARLSTVTYGRVAPRPVPAGTPGWVGVSDLLDDAEAFARLSRTAQERLGSDDVALVGAQVVREAVSVVTSAAIAAWGRYRRQLDWRAGNVMLRPGELGLVVGVRDLGLTVAPDDPLAGPEHGETAGDGAGGDGIAVADDEGQLRILDERLLGRPAPAGARPPGPAGEVAAVAAVIASARRAFRSGARHYWGTAALAAVNGLSTAGHEVGPRADADRARLLARRPDLARTVEVLTAADGAGGTVSCARRLTCCLLLKLPARQQCGTCSLRDRDQCVTTMVTWARNERRALRPAAAAGRR